MKKNCRGMKIENWPKQDRDLWHQAMCRSSLLDPKAVAAAWRTRTRETVAEVYGYALYWLSIEQVDLARTRPLERWSPAMLARYVEFLQDRVSLATVHNRILNLERALAVIEPDGNRKYFRQVIARLPNNPDYIKKRPRLQDPVALAEVGRELMRSSEEEPLASHRKNACRYQDGLQIALLAYRPIRRKNLSQIIIGQHLINVDERWHLKFSAEETKNKQPLEFSWPEDLLEDLECYLNYYRPILAGDLYLGAALWVSYRFKPLSSHTIGLNFKKEQRTISSMVSVHTHSEIA